MAVSRSSRAVLVALTLIFLFGLALRLILVLDTPYAWIQPDSHSMLTPLVAEIQDQPRQVHHGRTLLVNYYYSALFKVGDHSLFVVLFQMFLTLLAAILVTLACRHLFRNQPWLSVLAFGMMWLHGSFMMYDMMLHTENLQVFSTALIVFVVVYTYRRRSWPFWVGAPLAIAFAVLIKPTALLFCLILVSALIASIRERQALRGLAGAAVAALLLIGITSLHHSIRESHTGERGWMEFGGSSLFAVVAQWTDFDGDVDPELKAMIKPKVTQYIEERKENNYSSDWILHDRDGLFYTIDKEAVGGRLALEKRLRPISVEAILNKPFAYSWRVFWNFLATLISPDILMWEIVPPWGPYDRTKMIHFVYPEKQDHVMFRNFGDYYPPRDGIMEYGAPAPLVVAAQWWVSTTQGVFFLALIAAFWAGVLLAATRGAPRHLAVLLWIPFSLALSTAMFNNWYISRYMVPALPVYVLLMAYVIDQWRLSRAERRAEVSAGSMMPPGKLTVIVPAYNEAATIAELVQQVHAVDINKEIIIVDDGSSDGTREVLAGLDPALGVKVLQHEKNQGKGAAIRTGLQHATGDYVIIQDADLELDPQDFLKILPQFNDPSIDLAYGSRFKEKSVTAFRFSKYRLANLMLNWFVVFLYGRRITDEATCYKAFRTPFIRKMELECSRFEFCPEVTAKAMIAGHSIREVGISYIPRTTDEGKKTRFTDGVEAFWVLLKFKLRQIGWLIWPFAKTPSWVKNLQPRQRQKAAD